MFCTILCTTTQNRWNPDSALLWQSKERDTNVSEKIDSNNAVNSQLSKLSELYRSLEPLGAIVMNS